MSAKQQALWQQGQRYSQQKRWSQAAAAYESIVDHDGAFLPAWLELSLAYEMQGHYRLARNAALAAARVTGDIPPMTGMAVARRLRRFEALPELHEYVGRTNLAMRVPADKLVDLTAFFASAGYHEATLCWTEHALRLQPHLFEAHNMRGLAFMFAGRSKQAAEAFESALRINPTFAPGYSVLSRVAQAEPGANHVDVLRGLLARPGLNAGDEAHLSYALHNELHDLGDYEQAWTALERACRARQSLQPYDHSQTLGMFQSLKETFDADFAVGEPIQHATTPIFIVGMHRSGTTLLERILSGHPDVADAGETYTFPAAMRFAADHFCQAVADGTIAERSGTLDYRAVGEAFTRDMQWRSQGKGFITEKLNPNFILLGPIAKALPHARLLHMRRDPADTCFSNLRTLFTSEAAYSYDQRQVADYYKAYHDLMAHWREVLGSRVFDIEYDAVVAEPAAEAVRISEHCGLEFNPEMLRVDRASGMVATASSSQVRQGILTNRGGAWRAYERHLGPMLDRLAAHGLI